MNELLTRHEISAVVIFAAESACGRLIRRAEAFVQTNVVGTLRLLDMVRHYWKGLPEGRRGHSGSCMCQRMRCSGRWGRISGVP